jgi:hypothetical protein
MAGMKMKSDEQLGSGMSNLQYIVNLDVIVPVPMEEDSEEARKMAALLASPLEGWPSQVRHVQLFKGKASGVPIMGKDPSSST